MAIYHTEKERVEAFKKASVYPVVTTDFCAGRNPLDVIRSILEGGAKVVQVREKTMCDRDYLNLLKEARKLTDDFGALLIADDRLDAALLADADGVHLGQDDLPCAEARKIAPQLFIGVSTHNRDELLAAQRDGCSYLNIGPIFPTGTKSLPMNPLGLETLSELAPQVKVPFSVMGGIKFSHLKTLRSHGCLHIAAVTAFTQTENPAAEVRRWIAELG
ncbi:MAG: thiamine phosphate synthase [Victivallales bacterium]|nr:thiamine phosphate synthase [Victivallales bacterium]